MTTPDLAWQPGDPVYADERQPNVCPECGTSWPRGAGIPKYCPECPVPPDIAFHVTHSARIAATDPADCWYCGRERAKCRAKLWFPNERDAARAAADKGNAEPYDCPWCDGFHIATSRMTPVRAHRDARETRQGRPM